MMSHTKGVKHIKKKIAMEEKNAALRSQGIAAETKVVRQVSKLLSNKNPGNIHIVLVSKTHLINSN